jgi:GNAT superfamily N-acetyltransferase
MREVTDFPRIAEIQNMFYPNPITAGNLEQQLELMHPEAILYEMVALDQQQYVIGRNRAYRSPWFPEGRFFISVEVDRAYHGQGIGTFLYHDLLNFVRKHQGTELEVVVTEFVSGALPFAQRHGFTIRRHLYPSRLMLANFDEAPFAQIVKEVEASGIRFFSQAEVGNTPEIQRKLYEMNVAALKDEPGFDGPIAPFEQSQKMFQDPDHYRLDTQMIAADGERWIGKTHLYYQLEERYMSHWGAGVDRAYRGRHIALALKLLVIRAARRYDVEYLSTFNDSENAPMLAINRKLGYQPQLGMYELHCQLETYEM